VRQVKARVRAKGARGSNWFSQRRMEFVRSKARPQNPWILWLAGDFHPSFETERPSANPHLIAPQI